MSRLMVSNRRPTCNHLDFLCRAVCSCLAQATRDSKIVITNIKPGYGLGTAVCQIYRLRIRCFRKVWAIFRDDEFHLNNPPRSVRLLRQIISSVFAKQFSLWPCHPPPGEGTRPTSPAKSPSCRPGALTRRPHLVHNEQAKRSGRVAGPMNLFPFIPALRRFVDEFIGRIAGLSPLPTSTTRLAT